jgi:tetratricopeptide (TPR) repeat protein
MKYTKLFISPLLLLIFFCDTRQEDLFQKYPPANFLLVKLLENNAQKCYLNNKYFGAIDLQRKAIQNSFFQEDILNATLYIDLGSFLFDDNEFSKSKKNIQKGIQLYDKNKATLSKIDFETKQLGSILLANCYRLTHSYDSAIIILEKVVFEINNQTRKNDPGGDSYILSTAFT